MEVGKTFNNLPGWAKGLIAVAVTAGVGFALYKGYQWNEKRKSLQGAKAETETIKDELSTLSKDPKTKPTLSAGQMAIFADALFSAMDGYGTDISGIYKVFAFAKNDADVLGIIKAYGIRKLSSGSYNLAKDFEGALGGALNDEMNEKELTALNMMLAKRGIKYHF